MHWRIPFATCAVSGLLLLGGITAFLDERPAPSRAALTARTRVVNSTGDGGSGAQPREPGVRVGDLLRKMRERSVFWLMIAACASYTPLVEFGTHVTSYLREMRTMDAGGSASDRDGFVCLASRLCERRYR
uniref:Solute carrier family 40 protein n=1 Tax=Coccolithus braarudii TaxID=221442 RepID=A0A7S0LNK5_9EUKA